MSQLTQSQRDKIEHFKNVTQINNDTIAQQALQRCDWDVTTCIGLYFENPDSLLSGHRAAAHAHPAANHNANANANANANNNVGGNHRHNDEQQSTVSYYAGYVPGLTSLLSLISCMFSFLSPVLPYFSNLFSMIGAASPAMPYTEIIAEFKTQNAIFAAAANASMFRAVRFGELMQSNKCLFLLFTDANSVQCNAFIKNTLCNASVVDYLRINMEGWIGDSRNHEGRHLFAQITSQWNEKRRPFVCIAGVHPITRKLVLVHRQYVGGNLAAEAFLGILDHGLQRWETFKMQQVRNQQLSQSNRDLREMQDREYQRALQQQQQQQELQQEDFFQEAVSVQAPTESSPSPQSLKNAEQDEQQKYQARSEAAKRRIKEIAHLIESAPKEEHIKVALRLPSGQRVQHTFCNANTVESLFDFAMCHELKVDNQYIDDFELVCNYPKKIFRQSDKHQTLKEVGIERSTIIFVQESQ